MEKKLTGKEIELILKNTEATLAVEGLDVTSEEMNIGREYLKGNISEKELIEKMKLGVKP